MTKIEKINGGTSSQGRKKSVLTPKNTGYAAAGAIGFATIRSFSNNKNVRKSHKWIGYLAGILTLLHIGVVEYLHYKYKKM